MKNGERIVDVWHDVRIAHGSIHTVRYNADRFSESVNSVPKVFVQQVYHSPTRMDHTKNCECESLTVLLY